MTWYWIVLLIVIGYIFMATLTGVIYGIALDGDTEMATAAAVFWPIMLPIFILALPFILIRVILDWIL